MLKVITDFLFGKDPLIFDQQGNVRHQLSDKTWEAWKNKAKSNPECNWRHHTGTQAKRHKSNNRN